ncbi:hypothetical protein EON83_28080 [bacterium]|nr:MAG: hypothetical protein EON83_28080 [bacterium]
MSQPSDNLPTSPQISCLRCGSLRVLVGRGSGRLDRTDFKEFAWSFESDVIGLNNAPIHVCLDCGLFTGQVDVDKTNRIFEAWATDRLKKKIPPKRSN